MPKKSWTPEERKAFGDKMRKIREEKLKVSDVEKSAALEEDTVSIGRAQLDALLDRIEKLESAKVESSPISQTTTTISSNGQLIGVQTPYPLDPSVYEDPREELYNLTMLERYAFKKNYRLDWQVEVQHYETKFGTNFSVPKFVLKLRRVILNDDTGEPETFEKDGKIYEKGYLVQKGVFWVDPAECVQVARDLGLQITEANSASFLKQMRFELYKRWLLECMNPPRPQPAQASKNIVIGGKVYPIEEWNTGA